MSLVSRAALVQSPPLRHGLHLRCGAHASFATDRTICISIALQHQPLFKARGEDTPVYLKDRARLVPILHRSCPALVNPARLLRNLNSTPVWRSGCASARLRLQTSTLAMNRVRRLAPRTQLTLSAADLFYHRLRWPRW